MTYSINEIFYSLQGEGVQAGRPAVFCRFAGCNLWSGREEDREVAACRFCDTDFVGTDGSDGGKFETAEALGAAIAARWPDSATITAPFVVLTGGEPALQVDEALIDALHTRGFAVAIETNGTRPLPDGIDWVCVSPKADEALAVTTGDELKLVFPQSGVDPAAYESLDFRHFLLQPMDGADMAANRAQAMQYCLDHPQWRLSLQIHKLLGIR
ncbi:MAG: 7-carboxy-7-deazaguanine synthase [Rhodospirillales bacterium]|nr:7-carboxy-7-deazaguanine synthase [Rhodospirillales bacterium]